MIRIDPIPLFLLIHSATYHPYQGDDSYGDNWGDPVELEHVRLEPSEKLISGSNNESVAAVATLFIDSINTKPNPLPLFSVDSKIVCNGQEYQVGAVKELFATETSPHHWELELL